MSSALRLATIGRKGAKAQADLRLAEMSRVIRRSLVSISRTLARLAPALEAATSGLGKPNATKAAGRRRPRLSAARRAALKLQGQYLGSLRSLKSRQRVCVKGVRVRIGRASCHCSREQARSSGPRELRACASTRGREPSSGGEARRADLSEFTCPLTSRNWRTLRQKLGPARHRAHAADRHCGTGGRKALPNSG
jgi:hypothetical protein